ncbi:LLM class flavin-dependent oxidoreductase [Leucobacter luti]|uniref:Alkanesulfonate monooxygenase SsuD/methylene tetrahydromethanopterin reductase-like flavin-dependent oxidoreductase (Luciferase family) n=1 Tax=Leucobacter luti TaxID=340320 RepID=A0A4Q7U0E8_9MICO|nr:LLM class flavin-dependent oxidoreductase [Leucobacter luti]MBL3699346.1 LLM class flavin-dependent oxidoreductase [Leucobacter luti]RZT66856.1 alkanesulfonate monooxygenase SsuD/methylene tetrahydromethanopterin reductase-like flavin-dependent oxidoreductase (luciferase family) [Leucobacter luti]
MSPITQPTSFTVGIALDGAGWHPAAWREPAASPDALFTSDYWSGLVETAEAAGLDYVTLEDALRPQHATPLGTAAAPSAPSAPPADRVTGRLDALLTASWIAPRTARIGLIPTVTTTHTEPFHVATALQTLDHVSEGRGGWQLRISGEPAAAAAFGRRSAPEIDVQRVIAGEPDAGLAELLDEAADVAEVARGLWASWDADAEIRDVATGRFLDRDRVHHINFAGERFAVAGPSIVPRSPQGQLPITVLSHSPRVHELAAQAADVVFITPENASVRAGASRDRSVTELVAQVRAAEGAVDRAGRGLEPLRIVADLVVAIDADGESGADRLARLDRVAGERFESDARVVTGSAAEVAELIATWHAAGVDGVRLRPLTLPADLSLIAAELLPRLRERGLAAAPGRAGDPEPVSLRERFGLAAAPATAHPDTPARTAARKETAA